MVSVVSCLCYIRCFHYIFYQRVCCLWTLKWRLTFFTLLIFLKKVRLCFYFSCILFYFLHSCNCNILTSSRVIARSLGTACWLWSVRTSEWLEWLMLFRLSQEQTWFYNLLGSLKRANQLTGNRKYIHTQTYFFALLNKMCPLSHIFSNGLHCVHGKVRWGQRK